MIDTGSGDLRLARVPLCSCGVRGCGNVGIQFGKWLPAGKLPALIELLRELPWSSTIPTRSSVLEGNGLAAMEHPNTVPSTAASRLGRGKRRP